MERYDIYHEINKERDRQDQMHGCTNESNKDIDWFLIMSEEMGETAQALCNNRFHGDPRMLVKTELIETIAVGIAWFVHGGHIALVVYFLHGSVDYAAGGFIAL